MKTAISIPDDLFEQITQLAEKQKTSRSRILTEAVREFMERRKSHKLLLDLNEAYKEVEKSEERQIRQLSRRYYARKIRKEKW